MYLSEYKEKLIIEDLKLGISTKIISKRLHTSWSIVKRIAIRDNLREVLSNGNLKRIKRPNSCKIKKFNLINFPLDNNFSWVIGIIFGDGNICKINSDTSVYSNDADILNNLKNIIGGRIYENRNIWVVYSKDFKFWLKEKFGLTNNKSKIIIFPNINLLNSSGFLRGLLDSDGCWTIGNKNIIRFSYKSASYKFIKELFIFLKDFVGVNSKSKIYTEFLKEVPYYSIQLHIKDCKKLGEFVYKDIDNILYNKRKHLIWKNYFSN